MGRGAPDLSHSSTSESAFTPELDSWFSLILPLSTSSSGSRPVPSRPVEFPCSSRGREEERSEVGPDCSSLQNIYVVVQFYPWFKFYFPLLLGMVMYDNDFETKENKF